MSLETRAKNGAGKAGAILGLVSAGLGGSATAAGKIVGLVGAGLKAGGEAGKP